MTARVATRWAASSFSPLCEAWKDVPVIVLSAKDLNKHEKRLLESHVSGIAHKNSGTLEDIVAELRHVLTKQAEKKISATKR